jgi:DNA-binding transcriptional MerR regulator
MLLAFAFVLLDFTFLKIMSYTVEKVEKVAEKLRSLPPAPENKKRQVSKQEAVKILADEITSLQKRGYSIEQIAELMRGEGLDFATPSLRSYLQRAKQKKRIKKPKDTRATLAQTSQNETDTPPAASKTLSAKRKVDPAKATFTARPDTRDI